MYKIGELSKLSQLTVKTIRYYDSVGILTPDMIDRFTGYRYYSAAKLAVCNRIVALKELGFSLDEIQCHLKADTTENITELIDRKADELRAVISEAESQLKRLGTVKNIITEGDQKMFDMVIRKADSIKVAYKRDVFESKVAAAKALADMKKALPERIVGQRTIIINYETDYRETDFDLAVCVELCGKLPKDSIYSERTISFEGDVASVVCKADELDDAYRSIEKQLLDLPAQIVGAFLEIGYGDGTVELKVPVYRPTAADAPQVVENLTFVDDPEALGKWNLLDIVPSEEQFLYGHKKFGHSVFLNELYFFENGAPYWSISGWTKGIIQLKKRCNCKYTIKTVDGHKLLFLEMYNSKDDNYRWMPQFWVYEKESDRIYKKSDIRRSDNIDLPFVDDEKVQGKWVTIDFCHKANEFDPKKQNWPKDDLFLKSLTFRENGYLLLRTKNSDRDISLKWTNGFVLSKGDKTASAYEIHAIDGKEYMIWEWKSGDYIYGNPPHIYYYILERV